MADNDGVEVIISGLPISSLFVDHPMVLHALQSRGIPLSQVIGAVLWLEKNLAIVTVEGASAPLELPLCAVRPQLRCKVVETTDN